MHPEAYAGFALAAKDADLDLTRALRVLDVGGQHINGSVHDHFTGRGTVITTLDVENADIIADARTWHPTHLYDVVITTEVFEHVAEWREILDTMKAAVDVNGPGVVLITCASPPRAPHGATGAPLPVAGEWYANLTRRVLIEALRTRFSEHGVRYQHPPGDLYAWARL